VFNLHLYILLNVGFTVSYVKQN